jgi:hypothetical protein
MTDDEIRDALWDAEEWTPANVDRAELAGFKAVERERLEAVGLDEKQVLGWIGRFGGRIHRVDAVSLGDPGDGPGELEIPATEGYLFPRSALEVD